MKSRRKERKGKRNTSGGKNDNLASIKEPYTIRLPVTFSLISRHKRPCSRFHVPTQVRALISLSFVHSYDQSRSVELRRGRRYKYVPISLPTAASEGRPGPPNCVVTVMPSQLPTPMYSQITPSKNIIIKKTMSPKTKFVCVRVGRVV
jgi:hypothetical protein